MTNCRNFHSLLNSIFLPSFIYSQRKPSTNFIVFSPTIWLCYVLLYASCWTASSDSYLPLFSIIKTVSSLSAYLTENTVSVNLYHNHEHWGVTPSLSYIWLLYTGRCTDCGGVGGDGPLILSGKEKVSASPENRKRLHLRTYSMIPGADISDTTVLRRVAHVSIQQHDRSANNASRWRQTLCYSCTTVPAIDVSGREPGQYQSCPQRGQVFSTE